jgi:O-antigen/teichoic acid export membrane protein
MSLISKYQQRIEKISIRSLNIIQHIGWSIFFKLGSIIANFMMVPLAIRYLGIEDYSFWLTLSPVLTWFLLFDIGLGNGLRNKFAESRALGNDSEARSYVSTAYCTIALLGMALVIIMCLINQFVDWTIIFNTQPNKAEELKVMMPVVLVILGMQLVLKLITSIYLADNHHSILDKIQFFTQVAMLAAIALLLHSNVQSLLVFGTIYMALPVMLMGLLSIVAFNGRYAAYRPSLAFYKKKHLNKITTLGIRFFIIQMVPIILFSTDNIVISHLYGPKEVLSYNIAFKYFSIVTLGYGILISPFWSTFTEAWFKNDKAWILKAISLMQNLWMPIPLIVFILIGLAEKFYSIWIHDQVAVPVSVTITCGIYVAVNSLSTIYIMFINGTGKIQVQLIVSAVVMIVKIPLSVLFAKYLNMGVSGVIFATIICIGVPIIVWFIQYKKIMRGKAYGIWSD